MPNVLDHQEKLAGVEASLVSFAKSVPGKLGGWWRVGRGVTTDAEQEALFAEGRTMDGPMPSVAHPHGRCVTQAQFASQTAHGARRYGGCAIDFVAMNDNGAPDWHPPRYEALGALAEALGFEWGGRFTIMRDGKRVPFPDLGHVQVPAWKGIPTMKPLV